MDDWGEDPVPVQKPVSLAVRGKGRGLLRSKVGGNVPGVATAPAAKPQPVTDFDDWGDFTAPAPQMNGNRDYSKGGGGGGGSGRSTACFKCNEEGHMSRDCPNGGSGGGGGRPMTCYKCNEEGHMSRDCPTGGGGGGRSTACFKCNEEGHMSRDCPNGGSGGGRPMTCYKCNEEGHMSRDCPNGGSGGGGGRPMTCYKCNEEGHMSRDCPNGGSGGGGGRPMTCYKCNEEGHMSRDCPTGGGGGRSTACFKCNEEGHMSRDCPNGGSGGGGRPMTCYKCNEEGHMSRDCPTGGGGGGRSTACFKCNEEGHISRDCPNAATAGTGDGPGPSTYVPVEEDLADELTVKAGINFDNYDRVDVEVVGQNKPTCIKTFSEASFMPDLAGNIPREFSKPTPVQKYAIPIIQKGRDLMACSMTGSGKTAAFLLPIIDYLLREEDAPQLMNNITIFPRALIIAPTRELVLQTYQWGEKFTKGTSITSRRLYGKLSTSFCKSHLRERGGTHILSATPGRLKDFLEKGWVSFNFLKFVVLDEADRMLDMGFSPDVQTIFGNMSKQYEKQVMMFSATFPTEVQQLAGAYLNNYLFLTVGVVGAACSDVEQQIILVNQTDDEGKMIDKDDALMDILMDLRDDKGNLTKKVLIFVEMKRKADCLGMELCEQKFSSTTIHGDREQPEREQALRDFKRGHHMLLVATSVAARGLDIPEVDIVVNYDIPSEIDSYVHRIGRTGRCGNKGRAVSFYDPSSDAGLARSLIDTLEQAGQTVPEFLRKDGGGGSGLSSGRGRPNRDIRNNMPRFRHTFGKAEEENEMESQGFMSAGQNVETTECWQAGGDDGW